MSLLHHLLRSVNLRPLVKPLGLSSIILLTTLLSARIQAQTLSPSPSAAPAPSATPAPWPSVKPSAPIETRSPCDAYSNQMEAQVIYERNPSDYSSLDPDRDGQACEQLTTSIRTDGRRISSGSSGRGWNYEVWRTSIRPYGGREQVVYYIKAEQTNQPYMLLTTGNFATAEAAYQYFIERIR
jgi:hypothetical protein